jgi:hypothetical protein
MAIVGLSAFSSRNGNIPGNMPGNMEQWATIEQCATDPAVRHRNAETCAAMLVQ